MSNSQVIQTNKTLSLPGCKLTEKGAIFNADLSFEEWQAIGGTLRYLEKSVLFWIGDWINYGEKKYGEKYAQAIESTGYNQGTLQNAAWVASNVEISRRREDLPFSHHQEVASLDPKKQEEILAIAKTSNLTRQQLREVVKTEKHKGKKAETFPEGKFQVIYADPPWDVKAGPEWNSNGESRDLIYPTMSLEQIKGLPILSLAGDDAHLYLWTINKYIPETYEIAKEWGFEPSCLLTWAKPPHGIGLGGTFIQTTEHLLFCRRGTLEANKRIDTTWFEFPRGKHSQKPKEIRTMIEEVSPGKRIELFARTKSEGWSVWGNEV